MEISDKYRIETHKPVVEEMMDGHRYTTDYVAWLEEKITRLQGMEESLNLCKQTLVSDRYLYDARIQRLLDTLRPESPGYYDNLFRATAEIIEKDPGSILEEE